MKSVLIPLSVAAALLALSGAGAAAQDHQTVCQSRTSEARYTPQQQVQSCTVILDQYQLTPVNRAITFTNRGRAWYDAGNQDAAIADYSEALRHNPDYAAAWYNRGTSYSETGRQPQAIADFTAAIRINPNYTNAYFNRGAAHARNGDCARAIEDFSAAIRLNPGLGVAYRNRSICRRIMGDTAGSEADVAQAARLGS